MSTVYPVIDENWIKVSPRTWTRSINRTDRFFPDTIEITLIRPQCWQLFINHLHIADFPTWEQASSIAPMLYQLHKDQS